MKHYETYMKECFELARQAEGKTSPNPLVGCIVKMLFPGLTYFIRPQAKEIAQCLQLLQLIFSQLSAV